MKSHDVELTSGTVLLHLCHNAGVYPKIFAEHIAESTKEAITVKDGPVGMQEYFIVCGKIECALLHHGLI